MAETFNEVLRTKKEVYELLERMKRTGIWPQDDWELSEEYLYKCLAYESACIDWGGFSYAEGAMQAVNTEYRYSNPCLED